MVIKNFKYSDINAVFKEAAARIDSFGEEMQDLVIDCDLSMAGKAMLITLVYRKLFRMAFNFYDIPKNHNV